MALGAVLALVLLGASARFGTVGLLGPAVLAAGALLVLAPRAVLLIVVVVNVVWEAPASPGSLPLGGAVYATVAKGITVPDLLVGLLALGLAVEAARGRSWLRPPGPLTVPIVLLAVAMVGGAVTGHAAGTPINGVFEGAIGLVRLVALTLLVANTVDGAREARRALMLLGALVGCKAVTGVLLLGGGTAQVEGQPITFYEPTANWLVMAALLVLVAAALRRARLPPWAWLIAPVALASLTLSYRRSFWIGAFLGLALVVLIGAGRRGRRVIVPALAVLGGAVWLAFTAAGSQSVQNPVVARIATLSPTKLTANAEDRYRLDERRNVLDNLRAHPLAGLGFGVPWTARFPLSVEHAGGRHYTHIALLWFWLNAGLIGALGYLAVLAGAIWTGLGVWRRQPDPLLAAFGLGMVGAVAGLAAAEATSTLTGADSRFSLVLGVALGLLAAVHRATPGLAPGGSSAPSVTPAALPGVRGSTRRG